MSSMVIQNEDLKSFLAWAATSGGKGQSSMTHDKADRNTQIHATRAYAVECTNQNANREVKDEDYNTHVFVLGSGACHKPSKRKNTGYL